MLEQLDRLEQEAQSTLEGIGDQEALAEWRSANVGRKGKVTNALKAVGPDKAKIRDHIEGTQGFIGTGGVFNFSAEDHCGLDKTAFEMITVKDGKFVALSSVEE